MSATSKAVTDGFAGRAGGSLLHRQPVDHDTPTAGLLAGIDARPRAANLKG